MAYDLPFVSKARKDIGKLPGEVQPPVEQPSLFQQGLQGVQRGFQTAQRAADIGGESTTASLFPNIASPPSERFGPFPSELRPYGPSPSEQMPRGPRPSELMREDEEGLGFFRGPTPFPTPVPQPVRKATLTPEEKKRQYDVSQPRLTFEPVPNTTIKLWRSPSEKQKELFRYVPKPGAVLASLGNAIFDINQNEPKPDDMLYTGIEALDKGIGFFKGMGSETVDFITGPIFWPEEIAGETALDTVQFVIKSMTRPWDLNYGDIPDILTEGPFAVKTEFDKRPWYQQILLEVGTLSIPSLVRRARSIPDLIQTVHAAGPEDIPTPRFDTTTGRRLDMPQQAPSLEEGQFPGLEATDIGQPSRRATETSARASGADMAERSIIAETQPATPTVAGTLSEEAVEAAEELDNAVLEILSDKVERMTRDVSKAGPTESFFDGNNALGIRGDIKLGEVNENIQKAATRWVVDRLPMRHADYDDKFLPIAKHSEEKRVHAVSLANDLSAQVDYLINQAPVDGRTGAISGRPIDHLFPTTTEGLIPSLGTDKWGKIIDDTLPKGEHNYAPTLQDVAARLDKFRPHLSDEQLAALEGIRNLLRPWRELIDEAGIPLGSRGDVADSIARGGDGFYIPRGDALEIAEDATFVGSTGKIPWGSSKAGFERVEKFPSMAAGIVWGTNKKRRFLTPFGTRGVTDVGSTIKYPDVAEAVRHYVMDASSRAIVKNELDQIKRAVDRDGLRFAETDAMRFERIHGMTRKDLNNLKSAHRDAINRSWFLSGMSVELAKEASQAAKGIGRRTEQWLKGSETVEKYKVRQADAEAATDALVDASNQRGVIAKEINDYIEQIAAGKEMLDEVYTDFVDKFVALEKQTEALRIQAIREPFHAGLDDAWARNYFAAWHRVQSVHDEIDELLTMRDYFGEKVAGLMEDKKIFGYMDEDLRMSEIFNKRLARGASNRTMRTNIAEREVKLLEREYAREIRQSEAVKGKQAKVKARIDQNTKKIDSLNRNIEQVRGKLSAAAELSTTPASRKRLDARVVGSVLGKYDLPEAMANSWNRHAKLMAQTEGGTIGEVINIWRSISQLSLAMKSTADDGVIMIQGLGGLSGTRGAVGGAVGIGGRDFRAMMKLHFRSWSDPKVLGAFLVDFNDTARKTGRMLTNEWERLGLRLGGGNTEYSFGLRIENIPRIGGAAKMFNRAFGYYGDARRLMWADDMLQEELMKSRSLEDILKSGDMERIAEIANNMTGWSKNSFGGSIGQLGFLAPRFLQARLDSTWKAAQGMVPHKTQDGVRWGNRIDQRFARRSMLRTVAHATFITFMVNEMQGKDTDFSPFIWEGGKPWEDGIPVWNPNYNVMWLGDKPVRLLGNWDTIGRFITMMGASALAGARSTYQPGQFGDAVEQASYMKVFTAGPINAALNFLLNSDFKGNPTRDSSRQVVKELTRVFTPITMESGWEHIAQDMDNIKDGDWKAGGRAMGGVLLEIAGTKTTIATLDQERQLAINERIDEVRAITDPDERQKKMDEFTGGSTADDARSFRQKFLTTEELHYENLPAMIQKNIIDQDIDVRAKMDKLEADRMKRRPPVDERLRDVTNDIAEQKGKQIAHLEYVLSSGMAFDPRREAIQAYLKNVYDLWNARLTPEMEEYWAKKDSSNLIDHYRGQYRGAPLEIKNPMTGTPDFAARDEVRENVLLRAREALGDNYNEELITGRFITHNKVVDEAIAQYDADQEVLRPMWEIEGSIVAEYPAGIQRRWRLHREQGAGGKVIAAQNEQLNPVLKAIQEEITKKRIIHKIFNSDADEAAIRLGYSETPRTPEGEAELSRLRIKYRQDFDATQVIPDTPAITPPVREELPVVERPPIEQGLR